MSKVTIFLDDETIETLCKLFDKHMEVIGSNSEEFLKLFEKAKTGLTRAGLIKTGANR